MKAPFGTPGRSRLAGEHQGRDALFGYFGQLGQGTHGTFRAEMLQVLADDDGRVVGIHRNTGERDGKQLSVDCILVFQFKDGRSLRARSIFATSTPGDDFWS